MRSNALLSLAVGGCLLVAGCGGSANAAPNGTALTVNGANVPASRYQHLVSATEAKFSARGVSTDPQSADGRKRRHDLRAGVLKELVAEEVLAQLAAQRHITVSDAEVKQALDQLRTRLGGQAALDQRLAKAFETGDDLTRLIRLGRLKTKLLQADKQFDTTFKKAQASAKVSAYVEPCQADHAYPQCAGPDLATSPSRGP